MKITMNMKACLKYSVGLFLFFMVAHAIFEYILLMLDKGITFCGLLAYNLREGIVA